MGEKFTYTKLSVSLNSLEDWSGSLEELDWPFVLSKSLSEMHVSMLLGPVPFTHRYHGNSDLKLWTSTRPVPP